MVVGLRLLPTPALTGKLLIQKTDKFAVVMTIFSRIFMNGEGCHTALVCSSMNMIWRSTSNIFSSAAVILIYNLVKLSLIASNSFFLLIQLTTKTYLAYNRMVLVIPVTNWDHFLLLMTMFFLRFQETVASNRR